jgi:hypothetical protein
MLTKGSFAIDPSAPDDGVFEGFHDRTQRWGIWATPRFEPHQVQRIMGWLHSSPHDEIETLSWDGNTLVHDTGIPGPGRYRVLLTPDTQGLYSLGSYSWTWREVHPATAAARARTGVLSRPASVAGRTTPSILPLAGEGPRPPSESATGGHGSPGLGWAHPPSDPEATRGHRPLPSWAELIAPNGEQRDRLSRPQEAETFLAAQDHTRADEPGADWVLDHVTYRCAGREIIMRRSAKPRMREGYDLFEERQLINLADPFAHPPTPHQISCFLTPRHRHLDQLLAKLGLHADSDNESTDLYQALHGPQQCRRYATITHEGERTRVRLHQNPQQGLLSLNAFLCETPGGRLEGLRDLDTDATVPITASTSPWSHLQGGPDTGPAQGDQRESTPA